MSSDAGPRRTRPVLRAVTGLWGAYLAITVPLLVIGLLVTYGPGHRAVEGWDADVSEWFAARRGAAWSRLSFDGTYLANTSSIVVVAMLAAAVLVMRKRTSWAAVLTIGLPLELFVFLTVNYTVQRPRPSVEHLGSTPSTYSWPSGHVAATLVLYCGLALLYSRVSRSWAVSAAGWSVAIVMTLVVAWSRVYRGEHHLSDVLAGLVMGAAALGAAVRLSRGLGDRSSAGEADAASAIDLRDVVPPQHAGDRIMAVPR